MYDSNYKNPLWYSASKLCLIPGQKISVMDAILGTIVLIHEFGHFIFAKKFGVHVYEFSIGMGPAIYKKTNKKTGELFLIRILICLHLRKLGNVQLIQMV